MASRLTDSYSYILMKDVHGEKAPGKIGGLIGNSPKHVQVLCGELLTSIPRQDTVPRSDGRPSPYFHSKRDPSVRLYGGEDDVYVAPLNGKELKLLIAIERPGDRFAEFSKPNKLDWGGSLRIGDHVNVKIPSSDAAWSTGIVRYAGVVEPLRGSNFGVEIKVNKKLR